MQNVEITKKSEIQDLSEKVEDILGEQIRIHQLVSKLIHSNRKKKQKKKIKSTL